MKWMVPVLFGLAGAGLGFFLPDLSRRLVRYKCEKKDQALPPDANDPSILLKLLFFVLMAFVWAAAALKMETLPSAFFLSLLVSVSFAVILIDLWIRIIPNELVLALFLVGAAFQLSLSGPLALLVSVFCMAVMMMLFTAVAAFMGFGKVGAGDVKLAGAMGFALAYPDVVTAVIVMSAAFFLFTAVGLLFRKVTLRTMVPFAPFMMCGMIVSLLCRVFTSGLPILPAFFS